MSRAQESGRLSPGSIVDDLILMLITPEMPRADRFTASRRFAAPVVEAFSAAPEREAPTLLPPAPRLQPAHLPSAP